MAASEVQRSKEGSVGLSRNLSARRITGFACNQAFLILLLYGGFQQVSSQDSVERTLSESYGLPIMLISLVVGFILCQLLGPKRIGTLFARPLLYIYAVLAAAGSLLGFVVLDGGLVVAAIQGVATGVPCSLLLTAWGRSFGCETINDSIPEVFLGSLVGAVICLIFVLLQASELASMAVRLLPLASVVNIEVPNQGSASTFAFAMLEENTEGDAAVDTSLKEESARVRTLSLKVLMGTGLFGVASGLLCSESYGLDGDILYPLSLILWGAFLIGALSLLLTGGFGQGASLNKSYRLAVFLMLMGVLLVPIPALEASIFPGRALVLAGFLGLEVVLIALFVVIAEISGQDCALTFSSGFGALFVGQFIGLVVAGIVATTAGRNATLVLSAVAGAIMLLGYIFLFTERDFDALSLIAKDVDDFEILCNGLVERYGLSAREAEILPFALRGRTNERIAQELVIAKSTADTHLRRIYTKCGVHSRQELLDLAGL